MQQLCNEQTALRMKTRVWLYNSDVNKNVPQHCSHGNDGCHHDDDDDNHRVLDDCVIGVI
jgi:hypothetical protein